MIDKKDQLLTCTVCYEDYRISDEQYADGCQNYNVCSCQDCSNRFSKAFKMILKEGDKDKLVKNILRQTL